MAEYKIIHPVYIQQNTPTKRNWGEGFDKVVPVESFCIDILCKKRDRNKAMHHSGKWFVQW